MPLLGRVERSNRHEGHTVVCIEVLSGSTCCKHRSNPLVGVLACWRKLPSYVSVHPVCSCTTHCSRGVAAANRLHTQVGLVADESTGVSAQPRPWLCVLVVASILSITVTRALELQHAQCAPMHETPRTVIQVWVPERASWHCCTPHPAVGATTQVCCIQLCISHADPGLRVR